jgi:hypothetical protein
MKNKKSIEDWEHFFISRGISRDYVTNYIKYIEVLNKNDLPVIFELEHLSKLFGIKISILASMINAPDNFYRKFQIPKRNGGIRNIISPYPSLLHCQKWIYENILLKFKVHEKCHGFTPCRSIFTNTIDHLACKNLLKMDLKDFFPSIPINWVIHFFSSIGYPNNISLYLAKLCCYDDKLTQGSATSPYISNLLLISLDRRLTTLSSKFNLKYTRYADDLTFSGNHISLKFIDIVSDFIKQYGLTVNSDKTRLVKGKGSKIVTGLSVKNSTIKLPRKYTRRLRCEIHCIRKYGFISHVSKMKIKDPYYIDSLIGKINFWLQAEPRNKFATDAASFFKSLKNNL